jgi:DNA repair protein RecO (recombination protein O)
MSYRVGGILLEKNPWGEYGETCKFLTPVGQLRLRTRGTKHLKSKLAPWLKLFSESELLVIPARNGASDLLIGLEPLGVRIRLYSSAVRLAAAFYLGQLLEKATWPFNNTSRQWQRNLEDQESSLDLFQLLSEGLAWLDKVPKADFIPNFLFFLTQFELKILQALGYGLQPRLCPACGNPHLQGSLVFFDMRQGGFLCSKCSQRQPGFILVPFEAVRLLQILEDLALGKFSKKIQASRPALKILRQIVPQFLEKTLGQEIYSRDYLLETIDAQYYSNF